MKNKFLLAGLIFALLGFAACSSTTTPSKPLVSAVQKPENVLFELADFGGAGKIELPKGEDWQVNDGEYYNEKLDVTIFIQSQPGDFSDAIAEYTDSFIEVNKTDAPQYLVTANEEGMIQSIPAVRVNGKFNNGTAYVTRDYLFFMPEKVVVLMARADAKNEKMFIPFVDYIANSVKKS